MRIARVRGVLSFGFVVALLAAGAASSGAQPASQVRPKGPCDIYAAAGDPCVGAYSTTRALYAAYNGPLYRVVRQSDRKALDIGVVQPAQSTHDPGGYADAAAQDAFCANTYCWITTIYDQSPKHNDLTQAPRGGFSGPAMGGFNNVPLADAAPITIMGHKVYGALIRPGMGLRDDSPSGTAVDDQAEGQYWVLDGQNFNSDCCFDFGNAEIDSRDDDNGTMEAAYFGDSSFWYHGTGKGPWIMTDQENNLVGCVNPDGSKSCPNLPSIHWRFVTAIAKGEPHRWTSMGGDAQTGKLSVMFSGPRIDATYDPMRKQGAILLGNGGDNSNRAQGTFYEAAATAAGTFPTDATDQLVQANIVAAGYNLPALTLAPVSQSASAAGFLTFSPKSSQQLEATYINVTGHPVTNLRLSVTVPEGWTASVSGGQQDSKAFPGPMAPGQKVTATFEVTSGPSYFNGDLVGRATWMDQNGQRQQSEQSVEKARNVNPVSISKLSAGSSVQGHATDSFIELRNHGSGNVDLSNWTLTVRPAQRAAFSMVKIPAGTTLPAGRSYVLALSDSGLAAPAHAGDAAIHVRNIAGMKAGDTISVGTGPDAESRKIASIGTAASNPTTLWQPLPDGSVITLPAGSTNVPVDSVAGFVDGQKIALGYGASYPTVAGSREQYEVATVTSVGKAGTQAYLASDAPAGTRNIKVTSVSNISAGDRIRLDINSVGHGIETVTVTHVGTAAIRGHLAAAAASGATSIQAHVPQGLAAGQQIAIGTPANRQTVTIGAIHATGSRVSTIDFTPALEHGHIRGEDVVESGTGLDLAAPLKFNHAANLPFSDRGTGITFQPATAHAHLSNEPIQALGTGIQLDRPLTSNHGINSVVRDSRVTQAGYQGSQPPNQWFGGPELSSTVPFFIRKVTLREGSVVLRDASGLVVDSLNYGGLADPWAGDPFLAAQGSKDSGCYVAGFTNAGTKSRASASASPDAASNCSPDSGAAKR